MPRLGNQLVVGLAGWRGQLLQRSLAEGRDRYADTEDPITEPSDDVVMGQALNGVGQVRLLAQWIGATCPDADFECQLHRADSGRSTRCVYVAGHRSCQEHGGRPHERGVDDLEVVVTEGECRITGRRQRSEPQALGGTRLLLFGTSRATGSPRGHETPLLVVDVVDFG